MTELTELDLLNEPEATTPRRVLAFGFGVGSILLLGAILVIAFVVGLALARQGQSQPTQGRAPDFTVTTFDGETIRLADLRGKVVVLNFWASWCIPCKDEAPVLQSIAERYRDRDVVVLGVAYVDNETNSQAFIDEFGLTYPNAPDVGTRISDAYHIAGVPETFVIDRDGMITEFILAEVTDEGLTQSLERLLQGA